VSIYEKIVLLRKEGKISKRWKVSYIRPHLISDYKNNTIQVYSYNSNISVDGEQKGNFVKQGQKPKFYRFSGGYFEIIDGSSIMERKVNNHGEHNFIEIHQKSPLKYFLNDCI